MNLKGLGVAMVTPFKEDGNIDFNAIPRIVENIITGRADYIVVLGTTAEVSSLSDLEKKTVLKAVIGANKNKLPLIIGIGGNNTAKVIDEIQSTDLNPFQAILSVSPYYNKPTQEGIYAHFSKLSSNLEDISILLYNIPSRCGVNMEPWVIAKLNSNFPNIKAIKEASGSLDQVSKIISLCDITVLSGDDCLTLPMLSVGAKGVVSIASNIIPNMMLDMVSSFFNNKINKSIEIHKKLYPIIKSLFIESNPVPLKYILKKNGYCDSGYVRLPLVNITNSEHINVLNAICNTVKPTVSMTYSL